MPHCSQQSLVPPPLCMETDVSGAKAGHRIDFIVNRCMHVCFAHFSLLLSFILFLWVSYVTFIEIH